MILGEWDALAPSNGCSSQIVIMLTKDKSGRSSQPAGSSLVRPSWEERHGAEGGARVREEDALSRGITPDTAG